jgi:hypothetical protein
MKLAFHLALPCKNIEETKTFYTEVLGASVGRQTEKWVDINLYENQLTFTKSGDFSFRYKNYKLGTQVLPSFHFGVIVPMELWKKLYEELNKSHHEVTTEVNFMKDKKGEHFSFFIQDPNGFTVEFKSFKHKDEIFSS